MNNYETVFIVTPVLSDAQVQEVADKFQVSSPRTAVRL